MTSIPTAGSRAFAHLFLLVCGVGAPVIAACGGGGPQPPTSPTATPTASGTAPAPDGGAVPATTSTAGKPPEGPKEPMKAIAASQMEAQLKELGLDPKKLPPLGKMELPKMKKVMATFTKALGTTCNGCHDPNDFRAWTPKKKIASKMWDEFVVKLAREDGSALYCDSCHQGKMTFLDRHDKKDLGKWMDANFVGKIKRNDKKDNGCETCHGDPFEGDILKIWAKAEHKK